MERDLDGAPWTYERSLGTRGGMSTNEVLIGTDHLRGSRKDGCGSRVYALNRRSFKHRGLLSLPGPRENYRFHTAVTDRLPGLPISEHLGTCPVGQVGASRVLKVSSSRGGPHATWWKAKHVRLSRPGVVAAPRVWYQQCTSEPYRTCAGILFLV